MPDSKGRLSIILYGLRFSQLPYEAKLSKLRAIGYRSIQGGLVTELTNEEHKSLLDGLGMEMSCLAGGLEELQKDPAPYLRCCHAFGLDEIMIGAMPVENRADYNGYLRAIDRINQTARILKQEGVYLSYHNHAQEFRRFPNGIRGMDLLYEALDPDATRFLLDTHWIQAGGGDILYWLEKCRGRIRCLHIKDYRIAPANFATGIGSTHKQFAAIGRGNLPWRDIVDTALAAGIRSFIVEQDYTYGEDPYDCAAQSFETMRALGIS